MNETRRPDVWTITEQVLNIVDRIVEKWTSGRYIALLGIMYCLIYGTVTKLVSKELIASVTGMVVGYYFNKSIERDKL